MSKTTIIKGKFGTYYKGAGFEFIQNKQGFHIAELDEDGKPEAVDLVVTPAEAKRIVKEHDGEGENSAKLRKLRDELDRIARQIDELEADEFLERTEQGSDVFHEGDQIKIGCNTIPMRLARKLVASLR